MSEQHEATTAAEHLIGNLWFNLDALPLIAGRLEPDTVRFVVGGPVAVAYSEMCRLLRSPSERLSAGALENGLRQQGFDFDWLAKLQSRVAAESIETLYNYTGEINNAADLRAIQAHCAEAVKQSQVAGAKADRVSADLLRKLAEAKRSASNVEHVSVVVDRVVQMLHDIEDGKVEWGARTGFHALDKTISLVDGDLVIIAGRPSQGKTSLWSQIFVNRAKKIVDDDENGQVVMFSADDNADKLIFSMSCSEAQVNSRRIRNREATHEEFERVERAANLISSLPLYVDDTPSPSVESMYYRCAMLNVQKPIRLAGMDYMELVSHPDPKVSDLQKVEYAARGCKGIGNTLHFPFLMLSQLRKEVDDRRDKWPTAADVRYAGEAEADKMLLIMRPEHYLSRGETCECDVDEEEGVGLINIAKNKTGEVGKTKLAFRKEYSRFYDMERIPLDGRVR
jgi:replicative DNA helicase